MGECRRRADVARNRPASSPLPSVGTRPAGDLGTPRPPGDEERYADKRASFAKTLPHNDVGEVDVEAFKAFVAILTRGDTRGFETIPRDRRRG